MIIILLYMLEAHRHAYLTPSKFMYLVMNLLPLCYYEMF
jgi:hypothetical protein